MTDATDGRPVYVSFSAEINPATTEALIGLMGNLANQGVKDVVLLLSSPGGSVVSGITLYNTLRGMPFHLTTHNVGNVESIGIAVFLAGETRFATPQSTFMFHGVSWSFPAGGGLDRKHLEEALEAVESDEARIRDVLANRTVLSVQEAENLFLKMTRKDAAYAVSAGIVQEVRDVDLPEGVSVQTLVFQR